MLYRTALAYAVAASAAAQALAQPPRPAPVEIELKTQVDAGGAPLRLGDVAYLRTADLTTIRRLAELLIGEAPRTGRDALLEKEALARWIRARTGLQSEQIVWSGPERAVVRGAARQLHAADVERVARVSLEGWLAERTTRFGVESLGIREPAPLPAGRVELAARPLPAGMQPTPRMTLWVDVRVDGAFVRSVAVPFQVDAWREALVAPRGAAAGALLEGAAVEKREVRLTQQPAAAALLDNRSGEPVVAHRTVQAGETLTSANARVAGAVGRGDWVTLRLRSGLVRLESRAEALQAGEPGQLVRVRMAGATDAVEARVVARGQVEAVR